MTIKMVALALLLTSSFSVYAQTSPFSGPPAPQYPGQFDPVGNGDSQGSIAAANATRGGANDRWTTVAPGDSLFIDPTGGNFGSSFGPCRYVTNNNAETIVIPLSTTAEYRYYRGGNSSSQTPPGVTEQICCRPSSAPLCQGATGGAQDVALIGAGKNGYGAFGDSGQATATCINPPYGDYVETESFVCNQTIGSGVDADGAWSAEQSVADTCQPNAYSVPGACSVTCGGGNLYETVYNSCGQITSQGYSGPSCNTQSCCTPDYEFSHCNTSTAVYHDINNCPGSVNQTFAGGCTLQTNSYPISCSAGFENDCITNGCGGTTCYSDCKGNIPSNWAVCSAGYTRTMDACVPGTYAYHAECADGTFSDGYTCPVVSGTCSQNVWAP